MVGSMGRVGAAQFRAAGGRVTLADGTEPRFNAPDPRFPNFVAAGAQASATLLEHWLGAVPPGERT